MPQAGTINIKNGLCMIDFFIGSSHGPFVQVNGLKEGELWVHFELGLKPSRVKDSS